MWNRTLGQYIRGTLCSLAAFSGEQTFDSAFDLFSDEKNGLYFGTIA